MSKEQSISKESMCLVMRHGQEIWIEKDKATVLMETLTGFGERRFVSYDGRIFNTVDIVGIFTAQDMEDVIRRKNGQWKDSKGAWHDKGERVCPRCKHALPAGKECGTCQ